MVRKASVVIHHVRAIIGNRETDSIVAKLTPRITNILRKGNSNPSCVRYKGPMESFVEIPVFLFLW